VFGLTWSEIGLVAFLFLLVFSVGYLPSIGNLLGDIIHGYRAGSNPGASESSSAVGPAPEKPASGPGADA
jgi:Sec-independent protein translocase protein TatA